MNIIFDLGGVVFTWVPRDLVDGFFPQPEEGDIVFNQVYRHLDWLALDRGTLSLEQAARNAQARTGFSVTVFEEMYRAVPDFLVPIPGTALLIDKLASAGVPLYFLSNMNAFAMPVLEAERAVLKKFRGGIASYRENLVKPEPAIYTCLTERYGLAPHDSVFIDDTRENVDMARTLGFKGIHFTSPQQCREELVGLGISF